MTFFDEGKNLINYFSLSRSRSAQERKIIKKYQVHFFGNFSIEQGLKVVILSLIS